MTVCSALLATSCERMIDYSTTLKHIFPAIATQTRLYHPVRFSKTM